MNLIDDKLVRIADNIYLVAGPSKGQFPFCHGFLFTGRENLLIDAGADDELINDIDHDIGIDTLVISHSHPDHIRRWHLLSHRRIFLPAETPDSVFNIERLGERFTGSRDSGLRWVQVIADKIGLQPLREPDGIFSSGHIFDNGSSRIEAIHAPGHLDDHYCFYEHNTGTLLTTDIDFTGFGPWYGNPEGDVVQFLESVRSIMNHPYNRVCSSHRMPHEGDAGDLFNAFIKSFKRQKDEVLESIGEGKTLREIVEYSPFYRNRFSDIVIQNVFEAHMIMENLDILIKEGKVSEKHGKFIRENT